MSVISIPEIKLAIYGYETLGYFKYILYARIFRVPVFAMVVCRTSMSYCRLQRERREAYSYTREVVTYITYMYFEVRENSNHFQTDATEKQQAI